MVMKERLKNITLFRLKCIFLYILKTILMSVDHFLLQWKVCRDLKQAVIMSILWRRNYNTFTDRSYLSLPYYEMYCHLNVSVWGGAEKSKCIWIHSVPHESSASIFPLLCSGSPYQIKIELIKMLYFDAIQSIFLISKYYKIPHMNFYW